MDFEKEEKRIMGVSCLSRGDKTSEVGLESLKTCQRYLETRLSFPFMVEFDREMGPRESVRIRIRVHGLEDMENVGDDLYGLICHGRVGRKKQGVPLAEISVSDREGANQQPMEYYSLWFANYT